MVKSGLHGDHDNCEDDVVLSWPIHSHVKQSFKRVHCRVETKCVLCPLAKGWRGIKNLWSFSRKARALTGLIKHVPNPSYVVTPSQSIRWGEMYSSYVANYGYCIAQKRTWQWWPIRCIALFSVKKICDGFRDSSVGSCCNNTAPMLGSMSRDRNPVRICEPVESFN